MTRLFISYSHADSESVLPLARELQSLGFDVWFDKRGLIAGQLWEEKIVEAIIACDFFLLFISSNSVESDSVRREVSLAYQNGKTIIPLRLEKVHIPPTWGYQTIGIQWIECDEMNWQMKLLAALGLEVSHPRLSNANTRAEIANANSLDLNSNLASQKENMEIMIEIFGRDYINPSECDGVGTALRNLANSLSLRQEQLHLEYALKKNISTLADQVEKFRKICRNGSYEVDIERKNILGKMEDIFQKLGTN